MTWHIAGALIVAALIIVFGAVVGTRLILRLNPTVRASSSLKSTPLAATAPELFEALMRLRAGTPFIVAGLAYAVEQVLMGTSAGVADGEGNALFVMLSANADGQKVILKANPSGCVLVVMTRQLVSAPVPGRTIKIDFQTMFVEPPTTWSLKAAVVDNQFRTPVLKLTEWPLNPVIPTGGKLPLAWRRVPLEPLTGQTAGQATLQFGWQLELEVHQVGEPTV